MWEFAYVCVSSWWCIVFGLCFIQKPFRTKVLVIRKCSNFLVHFPRINVEIEARFLRFSMLERKAINLPDIGDHQCILGYEVTVVDIVLSEFNIIDRCQQKLKVYFTSVDKCGSP